MNNQNIIISTDRELTFMSKVQDYIMSQSGAAADSYVGGMQTLRMERRLLTTEGSYDFQLLKGNNTNTDRPLENRLSRNDLFFLYAIGIGVSKQTGTTEAPTDPGNNVPWKTFEDAAYFNGTAVGGTTEARSVATVWNGLLTAKTASVDRVPGILTSLLRYEPGTAAPIFGGSFEERGFVKYLPNLIFSGAYDTKFNLRLGTGGKGNVDGSNNTVGTNVLVLLLHGFIVSQASAPMLEWGQRGTFR